MSIYKILPFAILLILIGCEKSPPQIIHEAWFVEDFNGGIHRVTYYKDKMTNTCFGTVGDQGISYNVPCDSLVKEHYFSK